MIFYSSNIQAKILNYLSKSRTCFTIETINDNLKLNDLVLLYKVLGRLIGDEKVKQVQIGLRTFYGVR